tara:strand:- start:339 stop:782 length:444 start_codon:yes stop_codon:yes gene_type:complete
MVYIASLNRKGEEVEYRSEIDSINSLCKVYTSFSTREIDYSDDYDTHCLVLSNGEAEFKFEQEADWELWRSAYEKMTGTEGLNIYLVESEFWLSHLVEITIQAKNKKEAKRMVLERDISRSDSTEFMDALMNPDGNYTKVTSVKRKN